MPTRPIMGLIAGPAAFIVLLWLPAPEGLSREGMAVAAVALLMAVWWVSEAVPIPATALVPVVMFPVLGVMPTQEVTLAYGNHLIYLFMGGFMIAVTMEKWSLHKRIALRTIQLIGVSPNRIILGFMVATAFLSMWISNTATAMMMITIALAVIRETQSMVQEDNPANGEHRRKFSFSTVLALGIAYGASIGGVATLIGTPPNAILAGIIEKNYGFSIGFAEWMLFGLPLSVVMLVLTWIYLTRVLYREGREILPGGEQAIAASLKQLGKMGTAEKRVLLVFVCVALAWILRGLLEVKLFSIVSDASIAMLGALSLFIIPANFARREFLLDWRTAVKIPWDIIILFGGGFALAQGFSDSGLAHWISQQLMVLQGANNVLLIMVIVLAVLFMTEVTSNTATASLLLPVMGALAVAMDLHPMLTMVAVAIATSYAFMLPVATPPNAIVFASRAITIPQMAKAGLVLNLLGAILITLFVTLVLPWVFDIKGLN